MYVTPDLLLGILAFSTSASTILSSSDSAAVAGNSVALTVAAWPPRNIFIAPTITTASTRRMTATMMGVFLDLALTGGGVEVSSAMGNVRGSSRIEAPDDSVPPKFRGRGRRNCRGDRILIAAVVHHRCVIGPT